MIHMSIDNDIQEEGMCDKCKGEMENTDKCSICREPFMKEGNLNPAFDDTFFENLKNQA